MASGRRNGLLGVVVLAMAALAVGSLAVSTGDAGDRVMRGVVRCREFALAQPVPGEEGGIFAHDLNGDGRMDFVVTSEGHLGAYDNGGRKLWVKAGGIRLFPSLHHPSAVAGDMDGDGRQEVGHLTEGDEIAILDGATGKEEKRLAGVGKPTAVVIANLRGLGERDLILQYSQTRLQAVRAEDGGRLWETEEYRGIEHSPVRVADLDGDGRDEAAGATLIDHDGTRMNRWELGTYQNMDSLVIADIIPGYPLEVAMAEQRGANSRTVVVNQERIVFAALNPWQWEDPDKLAVGDFDPQRPGLETFNRSSGGDGTTPRGREEPYRYEEAPWVLDARGNLVSKYYVNDKKPAWWTGHGLEEVCRIDWDGDAAEEMVGKERHVSGAGAVVDPITGEFKVTLPGKAVRIYGADVSGDYREEVITVDEGGKVKVFSNPQANRNPPRPRYWSREHYRRQKQNWNYYSG